MSDWEYLENGILHSKELAEITGTTVRAIRHYLQLGLLEEPPRDSNGYRRFNVAYVVQVLRIKLLAESGASLKHISQIIGSEGVITEADIDAIDAELAQKEEQLRAQRRALKTLKDSNLVESRLSKTAQFDADVGLMIAGSNELPDQTKLEIQAVLNNPEIQRHSAELMDTFEALEHQAEISNEDADAIAHKAAQFYSLLASHVHKVSPVPGNALPDLVEELRQQRLSPAQSIVWEKFLKLVEG